MSPAEPDPKEVSDQVVWTKQTKAKKAVDDQEKRRLVRALHRSWWRAALPALVPLVAVVALWAYEGGSENPGISFALMLLVPGYVTLAWIVWARGRRHPEQLVVTVAVVLVLASVQGWALQLVRVLFDAPMGGGLGLMVVFIVHGAGTAIGCVILWKALKEPVLP